MVAKDAVLVAPHVRYQASFLQAVHEFLQEGRKPAWNIRNLEQNFDEYVQVLLDARDYPMVDRVPETRLWLVDDDTYIGNAGIRHHLNDKLELYGGHIGYEIRPSKRRMGYGVRQCQLAIATARSLGIEDILITCDDDNVGSYKIIEACGGILHDRVDNGRHVLTRRYWVPAP
jgi:predicted acetyltransferase